MVCLAPLRVKITKSHDNFRKKVIDFHPQYPAVANDCLPCGKCTSCRLHYMHEWGLRCEHESLTSPYNFFVTLTYDNDNLPLDSSLCPKDLTNFIKRVRKHFAGNKKSDIRYFACGEYGSANRRPHYHIIFFNIPIRDLFYFMNIRGVRYSRSLTIENLWGKGFVSVGPMNYDAAVYVAGYALKKQKGHCRKFSYKNLSTGIISTFRSENRPLTIPLAKYKPKLHELRRGKVIADLSTAYDTCTGEMIFSDLLDDNGNPRYNPLDPSVSNIRVLDDEFVVMSRNPGIGTDFYNKYKREMFKNGFVVRQGKKYSIPKFYCDKYYAECSDEEYVAGKKAQERFAASCGFRDYSPEQLEYKAKSVAKRLEMFGSVRYL